MCAATFAAYLAFTVLPAPGAPTGPSSGDPAAGGRGGFRAGAANLAPRTACTGGPGRLGDGSCAAALSDAARERLGGKPQCPTGSCRRVTLVRQRSAQNIVNKLVLERSKPGVYVGHGHFWVSLRCAGQVVAHGGRASETITVRITRTTKVGATNYATAIRATYENPRRVNLTRCPGGIGHDAARYHGHLVSALP